MRTNSDDPGHSYELDSYNPKLPGIILLAPVQELVFFKKVGAEFPGNSPPQHTGTNCQEVLRALCDQLGDRASIEDDRVILHHLRMAIFRFEHRAARIKGATLPACLVLTEIEKAPACPTCGHIYLHSH